MSTAVAVTEDGWSFPRIAIGLTPFSEHDGQVSGPSESQLVKLEAAIERLEGTIDNVAKALISTQPTFNATVGLWSHRSGGTSDIENWAMGTQVIQQPMPDTFGLF